MDIDFEQEQNLEWRQQQCSNQLYQKSHKYSHSKVHKLLLDHQIMSSELKRNIHKYIIQNRKFHNINNQPY